MKHLLRLLLSLLPAASFAARVDTLAIPSAAMQRTYRAAVTVPASYARNMQTRYPVLYLLHGAYGHFSDWLRNIPEPLALPYQVLFFQQVLAKGGVAVQPK